MGHRNGSWNEELSGCTGSQSRAVTAEKTETEWSEPPNSRGRDALEADGVRDSIRAAVICEGRVKAGGCNFKKRDEPMEQAGTSLGVQRLRRSENGGWPLLPSKNLSLNLQMRSKSSLPLLGWLR